ncbi:MAG TPA: hypothetical protein VG148_05115 [Pyrinomonadaceae bacterium]|nr:hypothetical protein [Pyrinomonadaceae bacterium]
MLSQTPSAGVLRDNQPAHHAQEVRRLIGAAEVRARAALKHRLLRVLVTPQHPHALIVNYFHYRARPPAHGGDSDPAFGRDDHGVVVFIVEVEAQVDVCVFRAGDDGQGRRALLNLFDNPVARLQVRAGIHEHLLHPL